MSAPRPDPELVTTRADLALALRELRTISGVTFRELVDESGGPYGTVSGWFSGHHVPTKSSAEIFDAALAVCGIDEPSERMKWWNAVGRARTSPARRSVGTRSPYKGLETFDAADAELFFGRGDVVSALTDRIRRVAASGGGVVAVLGASGSGKSSVFRAGLATSLPDVVVHAGAADARRFVDTAASNKAAATTPVIVFDQLEELWTLATESERRRFFDTVSLRAAGTVFVFGLRSDFYRQALDEDVLAEALVDHPIVVGRLRPDQLREVIVEPARVAGATVDNALVRALTAEMEPTGTILAHDHGALPMLSHALLATWQSASGATLTVDDYYATGGLPGAIENTAEKVYSALTDGGRLEARRIFERLVNIDEEVLTRRRVARVELFRGDGSDAEVEEVLESFTAARLLTIEEESVSVTHEALLTAWDRLRQWIDDDREWHLAHRRLTEAATSWDGSGRDDGGLLPSARLESLQSSVNGNGRADDLNKVERDFLASSAARIEHSLVRRRRRRRVLEVLTGALALVTVLAVTVSVVAFSARADADDRRLDAEAALAGQLSFQAERLRSIDPALAVQMALGAYELSPSAAARSALLDASALNAPVRFAGPEGEAMTRTDSTGQLLVTAYADGRVQIRSLKEVDRPLRGEVSIGNAGDSAVLAVSPIAALFAVGGESGTSIWNFADPSRPVRVVQVDTKKTGIIAFDAGGRWLAAGGFRGEVTLWDVSNVRSPVERGVLTNPGGVSSVTFSPDGTSIVTGGTARSIRVWSSSNITSPLVETVPDLSTYEYRRLAFSPDGRTLAAGTTGREVARWSVDRAGNLESLAPLTGFDDAVTDIAFSRSGDVIAGVGSDSTLRLWASADGALLDALPAGAQLASVVFGHGDRVLATSGKDGVLRLWPLPGPVLAGHGDTVFINPIDASGTKMVAGVGVRGAGLRVWDLANPDNPRMAPAALAGVGAERVDGAAAISKDGRLVAGGLVSGGFQLWDVTDPARPALVSGPHHAVRTLVGSLAFGADDSVLAVSPQDSNDVALWDVSDPTSPVALATFDAGDNPVVIGFSPDGRTLAVPTVGGLVELWDVSEPRSPKLRVALDGFDNDANVAVFAPDGKILAAGSADSTIRLWDVSDPDSPNSLARIDGLRAAVFSLNFDPSGRRLVAGVDGVSMGVWDVEDAARPVVYATLTAYGDRVNDAVFGAEGTVVLGGGPAANIRMWRMDPIAVKEEICDQGGMGITEAEWMRYAPGIPYRELC